MLAKKKVRIYAVEAGRGHRAAVAAFWSQLAERTKVRETQLPLVCFFPASPRSSCIRFVLTLISFAPLHPTLRGGPRKGKRLQIEDAATLSGIVCCGVAKELGDAAYAEQGRELRARGRMTGEMMRVYEEIRTVVVTTRVVRAARRGRK